MKYFIYLLCIIILLGVNLGVFNSLQFRAQIPNLLFLLVLFFSFEKKDHDFFFIAFLSGLMLDFFSTGFFGAFTLAFLLLALALHIFAGALLFVELNWKNLSLIILVSQILLNALLWLYGLLVFKLNLTANYEPVSVFTTAFLPSFAYNLLLVYPMYLFFNFLKKFINNLTVRSRGVVR